MNRYLNIKTNVDGVIIIQNRKGFTTKELAGILAFADTIVTTPSSVTCDMVSNTEQNIVEVRIDDIGITLYDTIT
jgi:hypothetical protein